VDGLVRLGALRSTPAGWQMSPARDGFEALLSASLADALQCQIDRLPSDDRCILEAAAGAGSEFTADSVARNLGIEPSHVIDRRLISMARRQVLIDFADLPVYPGSQTTAFRLRNPLIASLLFDRQPGARPLRPPRADAAKRRTTRRRGGEPDLTSGKRLAEARLRPSSTLRSMNASRHARATAGRRVAECRGNCGGMRAVYRAFSHKRFGSPIEECAWRGRSCTAGPSVSFWIGCPLVGVTAGPAWRKTHRR
jgi:hypothetical protein